MKYFVLYLLITVSLFGKKIDEISINGKYYLIIRDNYNEYSDKGTTLKIYKKKEPLSSMPILSFTLENQIGGCDEKSLQNASYEINGSTLTLYTHWDRRGKAYDAPKGDRIQHYHFDKNGTLTWVDGMLYIEQEAKGYDKESGQKFLYNEPKTKEEKAKLQTYIETTEHLFKGKFVTKDEAVELHKKVAKALRKKSRNRWGK